jgi:hypothetical protein
MGATSEQLRAKFAAVFGRVAADFQWQTVCGRVQRWTWLLHFCGHSAIPEERISAPISGC